MAMDMFADPLLGAFFILIILFTPASIVATALRFVVSRSSLGKVGVEDWMALGALLVFLTFVGCVSKVGMQLNGRGMADLSLDEKTEALKYTFAANVMFPVQQTFAKASILFLYHRLFGVNRTYTFWIRIIAAVQMIYFVTTVITSVLICRPVHKYWTPQMTTGHCINIAAFLTGVETTNSGVDFAMMVLALVMIRPLKMSTTDKVKLSLVFIMGGTAGIIGFVKLGLSFHIVIENQVILGVWALIQMAMSVFCCCFIVYRPLLSKTGIFGRLASKFSARGSWSRLLPRPSYAKSNNRSGTWLDMSRESGKRKEAVDDVHSLPLDSLYQTTVDIEVSTGTTSKTPRKVTSTQTHQHFEHV